MIDVRRLRDDLDSVRSALARRGIDLDEVDRAADLYKRQLALSGQRDALRARKNAISKEIGEARRAGEADRAFALTADSIAIGEELDEAERSAGAAERELQYLLLRIPNLPADDAPDGKSEADNPVLRIEGHRSDRYQPHQRVPHWEIGAELGILDLERGARISGSMFPVFRGMGATLARALCQQIGRASCRERV